MREYSHHEVMQLGENLERITATYEADIDYVAGGVLLTGRADKFSYTDNATGRTKHTKTHLAHMDAMCTEGYEVVSVSFDANRYSIFMRKP